MVLYVIILAQSLVSITSNGTDTTGQCYRNHQVCHVHYKKRTYLVCGMCWYNCYVLCMVVDVDVFYVILCHMSMP